MCQKNSKLTKKSLAPSQTTKIETKDSATNIVSEIGSHNLFIF